MKTLKPVSVLFPETTKAALLREAARQTLRTGHQVSISALVRNVVERELSTPRPPCAVR